MSSISIWYVHTYNVLSVSALKYISVQYYSGLLSKSRGMALRIATVLHLLFHMEQDGEIPTVLSDEAMSAAINFVKVTCQQTAYMVGRGLHKFQSCKYMYMWQSRVENAHYSVAYFDSITVLETRCL